MPHFYFDIDENGVRRADEFGISLGDAEEARDQAAALLPDLARDEAAAGEAYRFICTLLDGERRAVYRGTLVYTGEWLRPRGRARAVMPFPPDSSATRRRASPGRRAGR